MKSDVYFIEAKESDLRKRRLALEKLLQRADPFAPYKKDEIVPIKLAMGDSACVYHMALELVKFIVFRIKS